MLSWVLVASAILALLIYITQHAQSGFLKNPKLQIQTA